VGDVIQAPFKQHRLHNLTEELIDLVYSHSKHISVAEAIGCLELAKHQIMADSIEDELT
jgi:hypothetical protein